MNPSSHSPSSSSAASTAELQERRAAPLSTPTDLKSPATEQISNTLSVLLADVFALYVKTKNFHWHMSGVHFRDLHLMLDEQAAQLWAMTDPLAERCRKLGGRTVHSIGEISRLQRVLDNDAAFVDPPDMMAELREDSRMLVRQLRRAHALCAEHGDVGTNSLLETWIDQGEQRIWFLFEASRGAGQDNGTHRTTLAL
ncbi:Dps family protein [Ideonella margarita]|uniref:DNA starvation/stationary phase protection protein n=1 Tax=Ideonella margarita TaxID=2984191 RepID=A0ABU9C7F5_9BURK